MKYRKQSGNYFCFDFFKIIIGHITWAGIYNTNVTYYTNLYLHCLQ